MCPGAQQIFELDLRTFLNQDRPNLGRDVYVAVNTEHSSTASLELWGPALDSFRKFTCSPICLSGRSKHETGMLSGEGLQGPVRKSAIDVPGNANKRTNVVLGQGVGFYVPDCETAPRDLEEKEKSRQALHFLIITSLGRPQSSQQQPRLFDDGTEITADKNIPLDADADGKEKEEEFWRKPIRMESNDSTSFPPAEAGIAKCSDRIGGLTLEGNPGTVENETVLKGYGDAKASGVVVPRDLGEVSSAKRAYPFKLHVGF
ncbi:hypothetical protein BSKO_09116 [Bryopsis sp. KO-2023]|nr:hypothetical protein BSKO_09116 [Bryopsis sp. KO-2023]